MIGSARGDERGNATGGQAGDQTGREVSRQNWYKHSKGWRAFRAKDPAARPKIATAMLAACANANIGYDQAQRLTLYNAAKPYGYDPARVDEPVETDCSALVRVCCAYAGLDLPNFRTVSEPSALLASGLFDELVGPAYTDKPDYLLPGDILCTPVSGHTVAVVSTDSPKAGQTPEPIKLGDRTLKRGMNGDDVKELQTALRTLGYFKGSIGGNYKDLTTEAVERFQTAEGLQVDGEYGPKSHASLVARLAAPVPEKAYSVVISDLNGLPLTQAQAANLRDEYQAAGYAVEIVEA